MALLSGNNGIAAAGIFVLVAAFLCRKIGQRPKDFPPGPPTLPIIGNLHQIPSEKRYLQFQKWAEQYGPVYSLMLGSKVMIVLSSDVAIKDLVDKRGAIYSSRPEAYIAQDVLSGGLRPLFMKNDDSPAGAVWKTTRRLSHQVLNMNTARTYIPYQDLENKALLVDLLDNPGDFIQHLRRYTASLTTQMVFGHRTTTIADPKFQKAFHIFDRSAELIGSRISSLLDLVPALQSLPEFLLPIKKEGREINRQEHKLFTGLFLDTKRGLKDGTAKPCVCLDLVKLQEQDSFSDDVAAYISGSLLQAGGETTATVLIGFVQAAMIFPEIVKAGQEELDRFCGDRMPELDDVPELPYIRALAKECLRWMPGFFLGVPHAVTQDDTYLGYRIPKNATIILNIWGIHMDPKRHEDPRRFNPLRFIDDDQSSIDAANNPDASKRDHFSFGAGRRRCQGMHIADRSIFLALARMLWGFDLKRPINPVTGLEIVPDKDDLIEGIMSLPKPFRADILPRSAERAKAVREAWTEISRVLDNESLQWKEIPKTLKWADKEV